MSTIATHDKALWLAPSAETQAAAGPACFHCGEPCPDTSLARSEKHFCRQGCLVVHDLLAENGLDRFYDLNAHPGTRIRRQTRQDQWAYLDEPALQRKLLDFTDGKTSRVTFRIPAIHCIACVWLLENLFRLHPGVTRSQVNFPKRELAIAFDAGKISLGRLVALLASIGYEPALTLGELENRAADPARKRLWLQLGLAGFAFGNIMLFSLPVYFGLDSLSGPMFKTLFGWLSLAFALPVLVYSAADYWKSALLSLRRRLLTLDVPIALGLAALYSQSAFEILTRRGEGYLDSFAGLVFFLLCGRTFQHMTYERLSFDRDYKSFFPLSVTRRISSPRSSRREEADGVSGSLCPPIHEPQGRARHSVRADGNNPQPSVGNRGAQRTDAPYPADRFTVTKPGFEPWDSPHVGDYKTEAGVPSEERISLSQLQVGDRIVIRNGELIPADAQLAGGAAVIDYSFVTGESEPVAKQAGDYLYAGGKQIGGAIEVETLKPVSHSYLTSLWNHEAFQKEREDKSGAVTNRLGRYFTLAVIIVSLGASLGWIAAGDLPRALKAFTSVLIVACPCALALATPFTFGTAQRLLARLSVFLKNSFVIERLARVDTVVLDKTGTLTDAGAGTVAFEGAPLKPAEELWIRALTSHSTHPYSTRINAALGAAAKRTSNIQWPGGAEAARQSFRETPGGGIEGRIEGHEILLGSQTWLAARGIKSSGSRRRKEADGRGDDSGIHLRTSAATKEDPPSPASSEPPHAGAHDEDKQGSVVQVAIDGQPRGAFILQSGLRPETEQLIRRLAAGYQVILLSGDNERERERFQSLFGGGEHLHFNQSPLDKLGFIRGLQQAGKTVMMVGDGLNDAGALRQSDVGVAVAEKIGAFSPACDVILDARQMGRLPDMLAFARRSVRVVRLAFGLSILYNLAGVGIAAAGVLSPVISAILMPVSSISVVLLACGGASFAARSAGLRRESPARAAAGVSRPEPASPPV